MSDTKERSTPSQRSASSDISYSPMLERLKAQRSAPALQPDYTIGGEIETSVHRQVDAEREKNIAAMAGRLREAKGHVENEFAISLIREVATRDFERTR